MLGRYHLTAWRAWYHWMLLRQDQSRIFLDRRTKHCFYQSTRDNERNSRCSPHHLYVGPPYCIILKLQEVKIIVGKCSNDRSTMTSNMLSVWQVLPLSHRLETIWSDLVETHSWYVIILTLQQRECLTDDTGIRVVATDAAEDGIHVETVAPSHRWHRFSGVRSPHWHLPS